MDQYATKIGIVALLIWSGSALFNSMASALPTFEILSFALGLGFFAGSLHLTYTHSWYKLKQKSIYTLLGFLGVFGNELCYVSAFKFAPAAHITLINYLWPIIVIAGSGCLPNEKFNLRILFASLIGFSSVAYIIIKDSSAHLYSQYWLGYFLVILGTMMWSIYILVNRGIAAIPNEMMTLYCGIGFIISLLIHLKIETFIIPDRQQFLALLWLGIMSMCIAFKCWNFGTLHGNVELLSVLSYNNVLISTILLILFNQTDFNSQLIFSVFGLMLASILSYFDLKFIKDKYQQIKEKIYSIEPYYD